MRLDAITGRGIWMYLMAAAAVVVVVLSWRVPEPEQQQPDPQRRIEPVAYTACAEQAPPSYGTRALNSTLEGGCTR